MKLIIKLLAFSALLSTCLAITIPKPILIRLCETTRLARSFNLKNDEVITSLSAILNNYIQKLELPSRQEEECEEMMEIDNNGVIQVGLFLELISAMGYLLQPNRPMGSTLEYQPSYPQKSRQSALNSSVQHNLPDKFRDRFYNLFELPQSNDANSLVSGSHLVSTAASKVVSAMTFDYCKNIDFPESVDISNQIEIQKTVLRIISSLLKQHKKAKQ